LFRFGWFLEVAKQISVVAVADVEKAPTSFGSCSEGSSALLFVVIARQGGRLGRKNATVVALVALVCEEVFISVVQGTSVRSSLLKKPKIKREVLVCLMSEKHLQHKSGA